MQAKSALNTLYFSADHVVWASQAGILTDKALVNRAQKLSLYSWLGASCCTIASEMSDILRAALPAVLVLSSALPLLALPLSPDGPTPALPAVLVLSLALYPLFPAGPAPSLLLALPPLSCWPYPLSPAGPTISLLIESFPYGRAKSADEIH